MSRKSFSAAVPALLLLSLTTPVMPLPADGGLSLLVAQATAQGASVGSADSKSAEAAADADDDAAIKVSNASPKQGEVVEVIVHAPDGGTLGDSLEVFGSKYKLFADPTSPSKKRALFAVPVVQKPGSYKLSCGDVSKMLRVKDAGFQIQRLSLPASKNNFATAPGEEEAVEKAKSTCSSERFWEGNFVRPSKARTSAPFGIRRIVNGKLLDDYFHSGLDFAGFAGSPIYATAPGTVVLAQGGGVFKLHGNMVAIDHGQGVVSFYIHMQKVLVKAGQQVKAGEQIGMVGSTGRANGPHLHFSIYCNKVASSPMQWFTKAPL